MAKEPRHFAIVKRSEFSSRLTELESELCIRPVGIDEFDEIPALLGQLYADALQHSAKNGSMTLEDETTKPSDRVSKKARRRCHQVSPEQCWKISRDIRDGHPRWTSAKDAARRSRALAIVAPTPDAAADRSGASISVAGPSVCQNAQPARRRQCSRHGRRRPEAESRSLRTNESPNATARAEAGRRAEDPPHCPLGEAAATTWLDLDPGRDPGSCHRLWTCSRYRP